MRSTIVCVVAEGSLTSVWWLRRQLFPPPPFFPVILYLPPASLHVPLPSLLRDRHGQAHSTRREDAASSRTHDGRRAHDRRGEAWLEPRASNKQSSPKLKAPQLIQLHLQCAVFGPTLWCVCVAMQGVLLLGAAVLLALPCHGLSNVVSLNASDTLHVARLGRVFDPPAGSVGFGVGVGLSWLGGGV